MFKFLRKVEVRRYNFIVEDRLLYSGLFTKQGLFDSTTIWQLKNKRDEISEKYNIPVKSINISNTIKG